MFEGQQLGKLYDLLDEKLSSTVQHRSSLSTVLDTQQVRSYIMHDTVLRTHVHTYVHTFTHTYIHAYIHTYVRTYVHTYTYIQTYNYVYTLIVSMFFNRKVKANQHICLIKKLLKVVSIGSVI